MTPIHIRNLSKSATVCARAERADGLLSRLRGLLGRRGLDTGGGLLLEPSSGVHTLGMRFAIDIVALDRESRVVGVWPDVRPGRVRALGRRTHAVLELASGAAARTSLQVGDRLLISPLTSQER